MTRNTRSTSARTSTIEQAIESCLCSQGFVGLDGAHIEGHDVNRGELLQDLRLRYGALHVGHLTAQLESMVQNFRSFCRSKASPCRLCHQPQIFDGPLPIGAFFVVMCEFRSQVT